MTHKKSRVDLTIIVPHYNTPSYLKALLDTIPYEDNIQVIVVDDKSNSELELLENIFQDEKYRHVTFLRNSTEKKGAGVCRNIGLEKAVGHWLLFADADDYFVDDFHAKVSNYFDFDKDIVFFPATSVEMGTGLPAHRHVILNKAINNYMELPNKENELKLRYNVPVPWSKLIRKDLVINYHLTFDEVLVANDSMFSTKVGYYAKSFEIAPDVIYCVTKNKGSLTKLLSEDNYDTRLDVFIDKHNFLRERLEQEDFKILNLNAFKYIERIFEYRLGCRKILWLRKKLRDNNIKWFVNKRDLNPIYICRRIVRAYRAYRSNKKHFIYQ